MFVWEISSIHRQTTRYHNYNMALVCKISDTLLNMVCWNTYFTLNIICLQVLVEIKRIEKRKKILVMENLFPRKISDYRLISPFFCELTWFEFVHAYHQYFLIKSINWQELETCVPILAVKPPCIVSGHV